MITTYAHHDILVAVEEELKGKHREHCLCYKCTRFHPNDIMRNCAIAQTTYENCVRFGTTTPVYECSRFIPGEGVEFQEGIW
jgi:hypothetical protein